MQVRPFRHLPEVVGCAKSVGHSALIGRKSAILLERVLKVPAWAGRMGFGVPPSGGPAPKPPKGGTPNRIQKHALSLCLLFRLPAATDSFNHTRGGGSSNRGSLWLTKPGFRTVESFGTWKVWEALVLHSKTKGLTSSPRPHENQALSLGRRFGSTNAPE